MDSTTDLIAQLGDPDATKRCGAAEALRLLPALPAEAIFALKSATLDRDASVAASARAALDAHGTAAPPQKQRTVVNGIVRALRNPSFFPRPGVSPSSDKDARLSGGFMLLIAAVNAYLFVFRPISQALRHARSITYSPEGAALSVLVTIGGLSMAVFGIKGWAFMQGPTRRWPRILFFVAVMILAIGGYFGMEYIMGRLGYHRTYR